MRENKKEIARLVNEFKNGNDEAFRELYEMTYREVYPYALLLTGNEVDAGERMQDAYVKAVEQIRKLKEAAKFTTWLKRILYTITMDEYRRMKKTAIPGSKLRDEELDIIEMEKEVRYDFLPEERMMKEELKDMIDRVMKTLPKEQRTVILAFYKDEMSIDEIALMTGCPKGTVKSRLYYGRAALKKKLDEIEKRQELDIIRTEPALFLGVRELGKSMVPSDADSVKMFDGISKKAGLEIKEK